MAPIVIAGQKWKVPGIWLAVVAIFAVSGVVSPATFSPSHMFSIFQVAPFLGIVAIGQTMVILTGGIDLSVSGVIMATNILACTIMNGSSDRIASALVAVVAMGVVVGLLNGLFVSRLRMIPLVATLAMNSILFGGSLLFTGGIPKGSVPAGFAQIGQGSVMGLPISMLLWFLMIAVGKIVADRTSLGRSIYAIGANIRSAYAAGINTRRATISAYVLSSVSATISGLVITAYINLPSFGIGDPYAINSIAAVVVGGTLLTGGVGSVLSTAAGALFMVQLTSFTNMLNMSTGSQFVIQGVIIAIGVLGSTKYGKGIRLSRNKKFA
jgi:ribose/xylose/arabinose/galactoside ABC-type transport system permease subunit